MMLKQMVEEVNSNFNGVKEVMMEYVTDEESFESITDIAKKYKMTIARLTKLVED